jgi:hypothetical protein
MLSQLSWVAAYEVIMIRVLLLRPQCLEIADNAIKAVDLCSPAVAFPLLGPQGPCSDLAECLQVFVSGQQVLVVFLELLELI